METKNAYIEQATPTDGLRSLYAELVRSRDYGDKRYYPDVSTIAESATYWHTQLDAPERSPRARLDIGRLLGRQVFEIVQRELE